MEKIKSLTDEEFSKLRRYLTLINILSDDEKTEIQQLFRKDTLLYNALVGYEWLNEQDRAFYSILLDNKIEVCNGDVNEILPKLINQLKK